MPHLEEVVNKVTGQVVIREGKFAHFCLEWDDALIDESDSEFEVCTCDWKELSYEAQRIQDALWDRRLADMNAAAVDEAYDKFRDDELKREFAD